MTDGIKLLSERFTNFFTRSVAPSSLFFVLLYFNDKFFNENCIFGEFLCLLEQAKTIHDVLFYVCLVLLLLAYGYVNQILSQLLDNLIKRNYCFFSNCFFEKCWDKSFKTLRIQVAIKVSKENKLRKIFDVIGFNDYNAYQVLGKQISVGNSYVDEVKSIHTLTVAIILNSAIYGLYFKDLIALFITLIISIVFLHFIAKSRYKARNKRLYINYLLKEEEEEEKR